jgi:hypothetical protein
MNDAAAPAPNVPYTAAAHPTLGEAQAAMTTIKAALPMIAAEAAAAVPALADVQAEVARRAQSALLAAPSFTSMEDAFAHLSARVSLLETHLGMDLKAAWDRATAWLKARL